MKIVNLMAQEPAPSENYKGHPVKATLGNMEKALKSLVKLIERGKPQNVAIPKLATGVGGLDWVDVLQSIYKYLNEVKIQVCVYTRYTKCLKALKD